MEPGRPLNIAIVGVGRIVDLHIKAYEDEPRAVAYALCDVDPEALERRSKEWGISRTYADYEALLQDKDIDAIELCTPSSLHAEMAIRAAQAKKHVSVQKPMALHLADARRMIEACKGAGVVLKVCENYVFYPPLCKAKALIEEGAIGRPLNVNIRMIGGGRGGWQIPSEAWVWRLEEAKVVGGMETFDHGHHMFSAAWYLLGQLEKIHGWINSFDGIMDGPASFHWNYADQVAQGSVQFVTASETTIPGDYYANDEWFEIVGSAGLIWVNQCTASLRSHLAPLSLYQGDRFLHFEDLETDWYAGFRGSLQNFVDAIEGKAPPLLSGPEGLEILTYALAAQKSHQLERAVYIDEMDKLFPSFSYLKHKWQDIQSHRPKSPGWWGGFGDFSHLAPQCHGAIQALPERFDPEVVRDWQGRVGLDLQGEFGGQWTLHMDHGALHIEEGLNDPRELTLSTDPGTWVAILQGARGVERAFLAGKLKLDGSAEQALTVKKAFRL